MKTRSPLAALAAAASLAACGGGGGTEPAAVSGNGGGGAGGLGAGGVVPHVFSLVGSGPVAGHALERDVVVMLATGSSVAEVAAGHGLSVVSQFGRRPIYRLRLAAGAALEAKLAALAADARVRFAEAVAVSESPETKDHVVWAIGGDAAAQAAQWAPQALALGQAHALSTGAGVRVAVLDTGIDATHPAFAGRLATGPGGTLLGRDFVDDDADPAEAGSASDAGWGHGTHVASTIAQAAPGARLMPVRVLDAAGRGNVWVLAEALMWAIDPDGDPRTDDGARVVNISLGTTAPTRLLNTAIELATCSDDDDNESDDDYSDPGFAADRDRCTLRPGVVVMAAAGNSGSSTERVWPAAEAAEGQYAITASTRSGALAGFANRGSWVQLAAPGEGIVAAVPGGRYATWSGTSMATPWASGVAALVLQRQPDWKPVDVVKRLSDRSQAVCGNAALRALHAWGAVADFVPADPACP